MHDNSVAVVGLGYVGLPLAILAQNKGYRVTGLEYDKRKVDMIRAGVSPFVEESVTTWLADNQLDVTQDYERLREVASIIVCVPTPVDETYTPDLGPVISACTEIARRLRPGQLVVIESTINPGVCDEVVLPLLEKQSGLKCGVDFFLAHCPERINPGDPKWNVGNIARVVGGHDQKSLDLAYEFYSRIVDAPIRRMGSLKEAEAVKVVENSFRDVNIAFVNELAMSFTKLGIDVVNVINGAATKPFAFMPHYPGAGVGGHCIPVDPYYLIEYARKNGFEHDFLSSARSINNQMPEFTVDQVESALEHHGRSMKGAKVAVMGLSYKANVGDLRESPSLRILEHLSERGADIVVHDPYIHGYGEYKRSFSGVPEEFAFFENTEGRSQLELTSAMKGADAVIIATAHREYVQLSPEDFKDAGVNIIVDGRNCLNKSALTSAGFTYRGIGR
ncbi:MAG: nucleotide sugar dehydrogenase [Candidatus Saccharibacteria bacterium]|nr:nucleotide sugar dehydrogenase [Candidatus Saccharibacteria bacterium]